MFGRGVVPSSTQVKQSKIINIGTLNINKRRHYDTSKHQIQLTQQHSPEDLNP